MAISSGKEFNNNLLKYVVFEGFFIRGIDANYLDNCVIRNTFHSMKFRNNEGDEYKQCNLYNIEHDYFNAIDDTRFQVKLVSSNVIGLKGRPGTVFISKFASAQQMCNSNVFSNLLQSKVDANVEEMVSFMYKSDNPSLFKPEKPNYFGTSRRDLAERRVIDFDNPICPLGFGAYDLSNMLTRPSAEAHGIVWKVVVNGYDAQDEYDILPPLGVGKQKFEVYFNRPMDVSVAPTVAMGAQEPYNQIAIAEDGSWSADTSIGRLKYTSNFCLPTPSGGRISYSS